MGSRDADVERPSTPGWYPDPWSATGTGERYWDGSRWGTAEKPIDRADVDRLERPAARPRTKRTLQRNVVILLVVALVGAVLVVPRLGSSSNPTTSARGDAPPAGAEEAAAPLGTPAVPPPASVPGEYVVEQYQSKTSTDPVAWDPCRPIHYVVNPAGAPADGFTLLTEALDRISTATGLRFQDDGPTTETPTDDRAVYDPQRYDKQRWSPVLIAWATAATQPALAGDAVGAAKTRAAYDAHGRLVYVSGEVLLDAEDLASTNLSRDHVRAIMLHELGHLVGLAHTTDPREIMYPESQLGVTDYGPGDLRGLALLGTQPCAPTI